MPPKRKQTDDAAPAPATKKAKATTARAAPAKTTSSTASAKTSKSATTSVAQTAPPKPVYTGKFDLYSTRLKFLMSEYLPEGASKPSREAVYNKILTFQAKNDFSARIALADSNPATGRFHTVVITNSYSDEAIEEPVHIAGGRAQDITFDKGEGACASAEGPASKAPGYTALLTFEGDSVHGCIGVTGGNGFIKMRKVWEKITDDECNELFEGYWRVKVQHGAMLRRKGHGPSTTFDTPFWAVRAREGEDGKEIGIEAGGPVSRPPSPDDDNGNDDDEWDSGEDEDEEFGCSYDSDGGASYDSWDEYDDFYGASSNGKKGLGPRLTPEEAGDYYLFGIMPARYRGGPSRPTRPRTH